MCCASFGRFISTSYGTELIPLFPYLRAGLLKKGGGGNRLTGFLVTDSGLKGFRPQGRPTSKFFMSLPKSLVTYPPTKR